MPKVPGHPRPRPCIPTLLLCLLLGQVAVAPLQAQTAVTSAAQRMAPALDPSARREALVGRWYGETTTLDGRTLRWVTDRDSNGTYRTQYHSSKPDGDIEESIEMGQWGLSGGVFFTLQRAWVRNGESQRADPANVYSSDAYDLLTLNERTIEYRSVGSGKRFTVRRVTPEFQLKSRPAPKHD